MTLSYANYQLGYTIFLSIWFGLPAVVSSLRPMCVLSIINIENTLLSTQILLLYLLKRFYVVEQGTSMIVERLGVFYKRCDAGVHFLWPFLDRPREFVWYGETRDTVTHWNG
jgi:hypothetical protein